NPARNMWPMHHACIMYGATRLNRLVWSLLTRPEAKKTTAVQNMNHPDTFYGDTDSKILATSHASLMPESLRGSTVGAFLPEEPPSLLNRPFFQVEAEKVCEAPCQAVVSGLLAPKKYFVWGLNPDTGESRLKLKCNGI